MNLPTNSFILFLSLNLVLIATPSEANFFEQQRERLEKNTEKTLDKVSDSLSNWDPFVRGSNSDDLLKNFDQGTIPYREDAAERGLDILEDYVRLQTGTPSASPRNTESSNSWRDY